MADLNIRAILRDEFSTQAEKLIAELRKIDSEGAKAGSGIRSGMSSAIPTVQDVTDALGKQNAQLRAQIAAYKDPAGAAYIAEQKKLKSTLDDLSKAGDKTNSGMANMVAGYYAISQALSVVSSSVMMVVDATSRYDSITVRLNAFEGSAQAGARAFEKLQNLAKQPGLGLEQAASAYASLRALKESGPEAVKIIEAIAKANASMGGGAEEFGRAMNQVQQMLGKGKLMAEDINTISESIPNFRGLMLEAFGTVDTKVLNTKYTIKELLKGIEEAAAKLPKPGETIKNNLDNIADAWTRMWAAVGGNFPLKTATSNIALLIDKIASISETLKKANEEKMKFFSERESKLSTEAASPIATMYPMELDLTGIGHTPEAKRMPIGGLQPGRVANSDLVAMGKSAKPKTSSQAIARPENINFLSDSELENVRFRYNQEQGGTGKENAEAMKSFKKFNNDRMKEVEKASQREDDILSRADEKRIRKEEEKYARISAMTRNYADMLSGTMADAYTKIWKDGENAFSAIYDAFSEMVTKMVIEMAAKATIFGIFNLFSGGAASPMLGGFANYVLPGRAAGGVMFPGVPYRFNEDRYSGAGGEVFRPSSGGSASPNRGGDRGGATVHYHFAPGTSKADSGAIVRAIQQAGRERSRTTTRRG